jgi:predicted anti-sigma-YlaC factor YlaD
MITNHSYPSDKCTFELLSAYLDGEVTCEERKKVQALLAQDPDTQVLYQRLLNLRQEIYNLPTPIAEYTPQQLSSAVFGKIDRQKKKRRWLWSGSAIAAIIVTSFIGILNNNKTVFLQIAQNNQSINSNLQDNNLALQTQSRATPNTSEKLIIALNEPIIELPKTEPLAIPINNPLIETIKNDENDK